MTAGRAKRSFIRCGAIAALAVGGIASGQEALISAVSIDHSLTPPTNGAINWVSDRAALGPVQVSFGVHAAAQYNDNINTSESAPETDTILNNGVNLGLLWPATENSALRFGAEIGYIEYAKHAANSGLEIAPDSALTWQIKLEDVTLAVFDQISYLEQPVQDPALANVVTLPRLDNTIGARLTWEPDHWLLQGGYSYDYFISPTSTYNYLDRDSQNYFTRDAWRFADNTEAGIEGSWSLTHYLESTLGSSQSTSAGPYGQWQVTQALLATVRAGEVFNYFESSGPNSPASTLNSYYFSADVTDNPSDFLTGSISVTRETALGINQGSGYIEQTSGTGSFSLSITPRVSLGGYATYQKGYQPLETTAVAGMLLGGETLLKEKTVRENYEFYGGGPTLTWRMTDKLMGNLNYSCWRRTSSLPGRGYAQNTVSAYLGYTFW